MNNFITADYLMQFRLRTARHKRRMQHKDFEKQLIALDRECSALYRAQRNLGWVELKEPIVRGWIRHFVFENRY